MRLQLADLRGSFARMRNGLSYDEVILVATIARSGSIRLAATGMKTHVATLYRRLKALEEVLAGRLFYKSRGRLEPTAIAQGILATAENLEANLSALNRQLASSTERLQGELVVTTTDSLLPLVCDAIAHFQRLESDVVVRLNVSRGHADMSRNEADVAIRATSTPPEALVGQRVGRFEYVACVRAGLAQPDAENWIALEGVLAEIPAARWLVRSIEPSLIKLRVDSMDGAAKAAAAGLGRAILPAYMVSPELLVLGPPIPGLVSEVWILTHKDLRSAPRVRSFMSTVSPFLRDRLR